MRQRLQRHVAVLGPVAPPPEGVQCEGVRRVVREGEAALEGEVIALGVFEARQPGTLEAGEFLIARRVPLELADPNEIFELLRAHLPILERTGAVFR